MLFCCPNCFSDIFIQNRIETEGRTGNCNFCLTKNVSIIEPSILRQYFEPLILLYAPIKSFPLKVRKRFSNGKKLAERMSIDWGIFSVSLNEVQNILDTIFPDFKSSDLFTEEVELLKNASTTTKIIDIQLEKVWDEFTIELKTKNRYFPSNELDLEHLALLLQYLDIKFKKDSIFYRARISDDDKKILKRDMGIPPAKKARNGRGNPIGIPYLYLASRIDTAISEVRPSILDFITVGEFLLTSDIQLIDLRYISPFNFSLSEDFESLVFDIEYLQTLGSDLSKPINPRDSDLEYIPTQYLCEFIKSNNWDGVLYKSSMSDGFNIALFSEEKVNCTKTLLYQVEKPVYSYKKIR